MAVIKISLAYGMDKIQEDVLPVLIDKENEEIINELRSMEEPTDEKINEIYKRYGFTTIIP